MIVWEGSDGLCISFIFCGKVGTPHPQISEYVFAKYATLFWFWGCSKTHDVSKFSSYHVSRNCWEIDPGIRPHLLGHVESNIYQLSVGPHSSLFHQPPCAWFKSVCFCWQKSDSSSQLVLCAFRVDDVQASWLAERWGCVGHSIFPPSKITTNHCVFIVGLMVYNGC